jgi:hypothetical protein
MLESPLDGLKLKSIPKRNFLYKSLMLKEGEMVSWIYNVVNKETSFEHLE